MKPVVARGVEAQREHMPSWAAKLVWYAVLCVLATALAAYCELNYVFATREFESNQPWQYALLIWVLIALAVTLVYDIGRALRRLREDAPRGPGFWVGAKLLVLLSLALAGTLCFVAGRSAYAYWDLRFLRQDPEPIVELERDYARRYLAGAEATAKWSQEINAELTADSPDGMVFEYHEIDPEDNPARIVVDRAPDWRGWEVYEPEQGLVVASLEAVWRGLSATPGSKVLSFDGEDWGIDTFDVELREQYHRSGREWRLVDTEVRVFGRWDDY